MKDIVISTCIILAIAVFAAAADRLLMPAAGEMAAAARHIGSPVAFVLHHRAGFALPTWL